MLIHMHLFIHLYHIYHLYHNAHINIVTRKYMLRNKKIIIKNEKVNFIAICIYFFIYSIINSILVQIKFFFFFSCFVQK